MKWTRFSLPVFSLLGLEREEVGESLRFRDERRGVLGCFVELALLVLLLLWLRKEGEKWRSGLCFFSLLSLLGGGSCIIAWTCCD